LPSLTKSHWLEARRQTSSKLGGRRWLPAKASEGLSVTAAVDMVLPVFGFSLL